MASVRTLAVLISTSAICLAVSASAVSAWN